MISRISNINDKIDYLLSFVAVCQPLYTILQILLGDGYFMDIETLAFYRIVFTAIPIVIAFYFFLLRNFNLTIGVYLLFVVLSLISIIIVPANAEFIMKEGIRFTLFTVIPIFLALVSISNYNIFKKVVMVISWSCTVISLYYAYLFLNGQLIKLSYDMAAGYAILFPALVFFWQRKLIYNIIGLLLCLMIMLTGSRGPLGVALIYFVAIQVMSGGKARIKLMLLIIGGVLSFSFIMEFLKLNLVNSRTVRLIFNGGIAGDSGRKEIYGFILNKIQDSPFIGYGIFGDRALMGNNYSHNILLEILCDFGIILGSVLIITSVYLFVRKFLLLRTETRYLLLLFFCLSVIPLMISWSYLTSIQFAMFLGMFCNNKLLGLYVR